MNDQDLVNLFNGSFADEVQIALLRGLFEAYRLADDQAGAFRAEEAHDIRPWLRWIHLRNILRDIGDRFGADVESKQTDGYCHYTIMRQGRTALIASSVDSPDAHYRSAIYKEDLLQQSQLNLFLTNQKTRKHATLFAVLLHGATPNKKQPAFAMIQIPDAQEASYITGFDLFQKYSNITSELRLPLQELVEDAPLITVRPLSGKKAQNE